MAHVMEMPKLDLSMEEGRVLQWYKAEGDSIYKGEQIFEVETEELICAVKSDSTGIVLKIVAIEGETVNCFDSVAIIGSPGEDISNLI